MSCPGFEVHSDTIRYFPWQSRLNQTNHLFLEDILLEPSCPFEGDVTTDHRILIIRSHGTIIVSCPVITRREYYTLAVLLVF